MSDSESDNETESKFTNGCAIGMKWRIKENDLKDALERKVSLYSEKFHASTIPGFLYYLSVKLDKTDKTNVEKLYVYMFLETEMTKRIKAEWTISIKSASYKVEFNKEYTYYDFDWFREPLCKRDEIFIPKKKFVVDGIMEIQLEGTLKALGIKRKASTPLTFAQLLFKNEDDKDITIVVKDKQIKVHKMILCAKSPVFEAELKSGLMETKENKINITDFDFWIVKLCVEHMYEEDIAFYIDEDKEAVDFLRFADKYDIKSLHFMIQELMRKELSKENVVEFVNASITFNASELKEHCICFLMTLIGNKTIVKNANKLKDEILLEIGRRSLFSSSE